MFVPEIDFVLAAQAEWARVLAAFVPASRVLPSVRVWPGLAAQVVPLEFVRDPAGCL